MEKAEPFKKVATRWLCVLCWRSEYEKKTHLSSPIDPITIEETPPTRNFLVQGKKVQRCTYLFRSGVSSESLQETRQDFNRIIQSYWGRIETSLRWSTIDILTIQDGMRVFKLAIFTLRFSKAFLLSFWDLVPNGLQIGHKLFFRAFPYWSAFKWRSGISVNFHCGQRHNKQ